MAYCVYAGNLAFRELKNEVRQDKPFNDLFLEAKNLWETSEGNQRASFPTCWISPDVLMKSVAFHISLQWQLSITITTTTVVTSAPSLIVRQIPPPYPIILTVHLEAQ